VRARPACACWLLSQVRSDLARILQRRPRQWADYISKTSRWDRPSARAPAGREGNASEFRRRFDPQPFHLDEEAARASIFRGPGGERMAHRRDDHAAAGRERVEARGRDSRRGVRRVSAGRGPCGPGDELHLESEILEVRPSKSRPDQGLKSQVRTTTKQIRTASRCKSPSAISSCRGGTA